MAYYAPDPIQSTQFIPGGNVPASGGLLFVYVPGSTTKQNSYTDASASTARTNPIVLDSGGNIPGNGEVWIASTAKFVLAPSNDTDPPGSPYWTRDYVPGINNVTSVVGTLTGEWITGSTATYVGVTQFTLAGDQTALYTIGRRVKATVTGGDRYGSVTSASFATGSTTIGLLLDSSTLNAGLSAVYYGILGTPNGSIPWETITSSGTGRQARIDFYNVAVNTAYNVVSSGGASPNIWGQGNVIDYSNTTAASTFSNAPQAGATRTLVITSSTSFNSSAALTLGAATINVAVGDKVDVIATSTDAFSLYVQSLNNPGLTFLASTQAGNTSFVAFYSTAINSRCTDYQLHLHGFAPDTVSTGLLLRVSSTNGVSWVSTAVYTAFGNVVNAFSSTFAQFATTTGVVLSHSSGSRAFPTGMWTGLINAFNLSETSSRPFGLKSFNFSGNDFDAAATAYYIVGSSRWNDNNSGTTAVNAIQLLYSAGNISTGAVHLYGFKR